MLTNVSLDWRGSSELQACARDVNIGSCEDGSVRLVGREILADEMGNCNVRDTQPIDAWTWARKDFWLDDPRAEACKVSACVRGDDRSARLIIEVNGHAQAIRCKQSASGPGPAPDYWQHYWPTVSVPVEWLRQGTNSVILRPEQDSRWETYVEVSRFPNRSARSLDRGKTWDYDHLGHNASYDGEFLIRMELTRYPRQGAVISPAFDLGAASSDDGLAQPMALRRLGVAWEADTPPETTVSGELRAGPTPDYDPRSWSAWNPAAAFVARPRDRFGQWRITLQTRDPMVTPMLREVRVTADVETEPADWGKLVEAENPPIVRSSLPFGYQAPTARTTMLRERWRLDDLVAGATDDFEQVQRLARWVRQQWTDGWNPQWKALRLSPPWDAPLILELTSQDLSQGMCTHYSTVFVHACASFGIPARHVIHRAHCTSEVWSDRWGKWIWFDVGGDTNDETMSVYHVQKDGLPLSALEARSTWLSGDLSGLRLVGPNAEKRFKVEDRLKTLDRFCIVLRNDQMTSLNPGEPEHGVMVYHYEGFLWWRDAAFPPLPWVSLTSGRVADFYWTVNRLRIHLQRSKQRGILAVNLESAMPHLDAFQAKTDDGAWRDCSAIFDWPLHDGENRLAARAVSAFGVVGPESWVRVDV